MEAGEHPLVSPATPNFLLKLKFNPSACLGRYLAPYLLKIQAFLSSTHLDTDNKLLASAGCCVAQQPSFSGRVAPLLLADSASLFPGVPAAGWAGLGWAGLGWLGWAG